LTYYTGTASDNAGNPVQYEFTWGDGTNSGWLAAGTFGTSHRWSATGSYSVTAQARSTANTSVLSSQSGALVVYINTETVATPSTPAGPSIGLPGTSYSYSTGGASDNLGNPVQYEFTWGDGTNSGWLAAGTTSLSHSWPIGSWGVTAQARSATNTAVLSSQSVALSVTIPETVSAPPTPAGSTSGVTGTAYTYSTGAAIDNGGNPVQYQFTWGDGTNSGWLAASTTSASHTWSAAGPYSVTAQARSATNTWVLSSQSGALSVKIYNVGTLFFVPMTPCRVVDTRNASGPLGGPAIAGGSSRDFTLPSGSCGIPSTALAYSLNAAMIPGGKGWITIWPTGQTQPGTASVNSPDGRVKSSGAIVQAGTGGAISVYASPTTVSTNVALDVNGYFVPANGNPGALEFYPLTPCRVADTRNATGPLGGPYITGGSTRVFPIFSAISCNIPSAAQAFSFNITVVPKGSKMRWLTAWPSNESQPGVSTLNDPPGVTLSNGAIVPAPSDNSGDVSLYVTEDTNVVIDINGYFAAPATGGLSLYTLSPCRALDTRSSGSPFTGTLAIDVVDSGCGAPATAQDYIFNATLVPESSHGYLTLWEQGQTMPVAANVTVSDGTNTGNMALVPTNNGWIDAYFNNSTYLVLDLFGYFAP
jgi:hypothetical protein